MDDFDIRVGGILYSNDDLVGAEIASRILGISPRTCRDWATKGIISVFKLNSRVTRYSIESLVEFVDEHRCDAKSS